MDYLVRNELEDKFSGKAFNPWCFGEGYEDYNKHEWVRDGNEVWACAYEKTSSKAGMLLKQQPIKGVIKKTGYHFSFYPYCQKSNKLRKQCVNIENRVLCKDEETCKQVYNYLVQRHLDELNSLVEEVKKDFI